MEKFQIIKASTEEDCKICDEFMLSLMKFEAKIDDSISSKMKISEFHKQFLNQDSVFMAYAKTDKPIGYIYGYVKNLKGTSVTTNRVFVDSLFVEEEYRKSGVGKMLLKAFDEWAKEKFNNDYEIELLCLSKNKNALAFYENLGYQEVKTTLRKSKPNSSEKGL